jgi:hypothetical protein
MTTHDQNKKAIKEGQQGGPAQKNQNTQLGLSGEEALNHPGGVQQDLPPPQQQAELNPKQLPKEMQQGGSRPHPGQTGAPGVKGKQDAPQNQKR